MPTAAQVIKAPTAAERRLVRLADLANRSGRMMYERAKLANELIADHAWVDGVGDEAKAYEELEAHFADLGGLVSVENLTLLYRDFDEGVWLANNWSLKVLYAKWQETHRSEDTRSGTRTSVKLKDFEAEKKRAEEAECAYKRAQQEKQTVLEEASKLRSEVHKVESEAARRIRELELENAQLKGRITELERLAGERGGPNAGR